ncbi:MAG: hypothetical protein ACOVMF_06035 [Aquiluna sp.]
MRKLALFTLAFSAFISPSYADELDNRSDETEQVIPPAIVDGQVDPTATEPLNLSEIEVTTKTPADEFISATTPLLVALMLGSVGLVIFTLVSQSKKDAAQLD